MINKISGDECCDNDQMISTRESSPEQVSPDGFQNAKTNTCSKSANKVSKFNVGQDDCCGGGGSHETRIFFKLINITPICKALNTAIKFIVSYTKYYFYGLVILLFPLIYYRFFIRKGFTPFNDLSVLLEMLTTAFIVGMAYWSHSEIYPPKDPGFVEWDHFRTEEYRIQHKADRQRWINKRNGIETEEVRDLDEELKKKKAKYPLECDKCGTLKVLGVHHDSKTGRCVYKMDHYCPWTNNAVGYLTLKPFILFLFYVASVCFITAGFMYRQAWVLRMQHISLVQSFVPAHTGVKHFLTMQYVNEDEKKEILDANEREYQRQVEFEKEHPELISWALIKDLLFNWQFSRFYWLYSWETFWDGATIFTTVLFGIYTFGLMVQTLNYARKETSMIEDMKVKMFTKDQKKYRKEIREFFEKQKRRKTLTLTQLWELVFGESTLFCFYTWIPRYRKERTMDMASQEYLNNLSEEDKKCN